MALKLQIKTIVIRAIAVSALLTAAALSYCLIGSGVCSISTFFITADLQDRHFYRLGKYEAAAKRFAGLQWQAASFYRAGDFKQAAALYSGMSSAEGAFNHGNALVMLGKYEEAVKSYDRALALRPDWNDAQINRQIAAARAELVKKEGGEMTGGKLAADEFVFEKSGSKNEPSDQTDVTPAAGDAEMQAMWLRRVQTRPADFLRAKFAYQHAMKNQVK